MPLSKVALMCLETSAFIKSDIFSSRNKARFTRWKLREIAATRIRRGQFETKYKLLRENPNDFFLNLRVSMDIFDYILEHIKEDLAARNVKGMSPEEQLFMTLKYVMGEVPINVLAKNFGFGPRAAHKIISMTFEDIWWRLSPIHLRPPTHAEINGLAKEYYEKWKFPNCVGAIGGKYIRLFNTAKNKKGIINAVVDANFRFLTVYVERKRSSEESFVKNMFDISGMQCLPGTEVMLPLVVIGNDAYPLKNNLMKPYPFRATQICPEKGYFNERLKQARVPVDCAFEILSEKWKIFNMPFSLRIEETKLVVKVVCLLYNIVKDREGDRDPHFCRFGQVDNGCIYLNLLKHKSRKHNRASSIAISIRDQMKDYIKDY